MRFLNRFFNARAAKAPEAERAFSPGALINSKTKGRTIAPKYGDSGFTRPLMWSAYLKTAPLNAAINTIAETSIRKGYYFEDQEKGADPSLAQNLIRDKAAALLDSPGGLLTGAELLKGVILSLEIFGDAWLEIQYKTIKSPGGRLIAREPFKFWLLPPEQMFIKQDPKTGTITGYYQKRAGGKPAVDFSPERVLHIALNPGPGSHYGTPPMVAAKSLIATWLRAIEYNHDYYFNHGRPKALINLGDITDSQVKRLINQIDQDMTAEAGGYTFINTPQMTVAPLSDSNKDMEFNALLRYVETRILSVYNVPQIKIGISETGGAGMITGTTQISTFYDSIEALNSLIEAALNQFFKERLGLSRYAFKIRSPRPLIDPGLINAYAVLMDKQALTPNELREVLGLPPLPGGDSVITPVAPMAPIFSQSEQTRTTPNQTPADPKGAYPQPPALGGSPSDSTPRANRAAPESATEPAGPDMPPHEFNRPGAIEKAALVAAADNAEAFMEEILKGIRALYRRTLGDSQRSERKVINPAAFKSEVQALIDNSTGAYLERSNTQSLELWTEGEASISGQPPEPGALPQELISTLNEKLAIEPIKTFSAEIGDQINGLIDSTIEEGGISLYKMTATLEDNIPEALHSQQWKLERIERTRFNTIANRARHKAMERLGTRAFKLLGVRDSRQCDICRALGGKIFLITDLAHLPPFHPNCRDVAVPLTEAQYQEALKGGLIMGSEAPGTGGGA